jgi:purine-binding chemotaxis protein CheW
MAAEQTAKLEAVDSGDAKQQEASWHPGQGAHVVILKSGEGYFGIDINLVQAIVLMQEITAVPGSVSYIAGMTDLRGRIIPVAEFATLLGSDPGERGDETRILVVEHGGDHIGLIVDAVTEVMMVDGGKIEDVANIGAQDYDFIVAVAKLEEHLVSLVDVDRLLVFANSETIAVKGQRRPDILADFATHAQRSAA